MASQIDSERVKKYIADALKNIQTEADPHLLDEYRSLIKKEVSFFRRSYFSAYLLMALNQGEKGRFERNPVRGRSRRAPRQASPGEESSRPESPRYPLSDEESVRLFISIGRSRRVFPREILGLINAKTALPKEDIGAIRILDNYSFIQVRATVADKIIDALNGSSFRGRVLAVNYARNRKEDLPADFSPGAEPDFDEAPGEVPERFSAEEPRQPDGLYQDEEPDYGDELHQEEDDNTDKEDV
jgi:hypothetical protein